MSMRKVKCPHCDGTGKIAAEAVTVGSMILTMRRAKGMTQEALSQAARLSRAQIANIESGRTDMPIKTLQRFADALGCSARDLLP